MVEFLEKNLLDDFSFKDFFFKPEFVATVLQLKKNFV
jgi:hypothetical protein